MTPTESALREEAEKVALDTYGHMSVLSSRKQAVGLLADALVAFAQRHGARAVWKCFHCEFETSEFSEAAAHFGDRDEELPICQTWKAMNAKGRIGEYQSVIGELNAERERNGQLITANEGMEFRLLEYENLVGSRFKGCRSLNDAFNLYDSMEGRALAAEERYAELERHGARERLRGRIEGKQQARDMLEGIEATTVQVMLGCEIYGHKQELAAPEKGEEVK